MVPEPCSVSLQSTVRLPLVSPVSTMKSTVAAGAMVTVSPHAGQSSPFERVTSPMQSLRTDSELPP
jgi:hypothetical protein